MLGILNKIVIPIITISNLSAIARGLSAWDDYLKFSKEMLLQIHKSNYLIAIYTYIVTSSESINA